MPCCKLQIVPGEIQRGDAINYLGYEIDLQKIRRHQWQTLNDFQGLLGVISYLQPTIRIGPDKLCNLVKTLHDNNDLNSHSKLSAEAERELPYVENNTDRECGLCRFEA